MSKDWFHLCLMDNHFQIIWEEQVDNQPDAIFSFISRLLKRLKIKNLDQIILCMEHTGIYVQHLVRCWLSKGGGLSMIPATKVSQYLAGSKGWEEKDDPIDAQRLAEYGIRYSDKLQLWKLKAEPLELLQRLHRQRDRLKKVINLLQVPLKESQQFDTACISQTLQANQADSIRALKSDLKRVEKQLVHIIDQEPYLKQLFKLITSVDGVGPVIAREVIITTAAFTEFSPKEAKRYARYAGVVPLKNKSGTSVRKRSKTPKRANKKVKTLLSMGATCLIPTNSDLGQYYRRRCQEGKEHWVIINAMRNKLILRIFAVVRKQVMYKKNLNFCLH